MSEVRADEFDAFFEAVHGYRPFRWQSMLLSRVLESGWPKGIDLPTASGKTACLDIAVFALACSASRKNPTDRHPRRIFFVVDRRVVVDAAYDRARSIRKALASSDDAIVQRVAGALRRLSSGVSPLIACRMRGGTARDLQWRMDPSQPAIITATVDQVGSRLLFAGYGTSDRTAPIDAALTACDSLILLDEAHCAVPFSQTARAIQRYSSPRWAEEPVTAALRFSVLSATLPEEIGDVFPSPDQREQALADQKLRERIDAPKRARLDIAKAPGEKDWSLGNMRSKDDLVLAAAQAASDFVAGGMQRVAVMVNRVRTAARIAEQVATLEREGLADVVLMTGRMRALDRDDLVRRWQDRLQSENPTPVERPVVVVTTQCLEVGADLSFDALVTECASLDALRQRFGRLDRLGTLYADQSDSIPAKILIRSADRKRPTAKQEREGDVDPVYGSALPETWHWLSQHADRKVVDFGISAMDQMLSEEAGGRAALLAPAPDAPVMLPGHLDLLVQTAPRPAHQPDPAVFLHGPGRGRPEARVVFRSDLPVDGNAEIWRDTVALLPPTSTEALTVPLSVLNRWLRGTSVARGSDSDVEGEAEPLTDVAPGGEPKGEPIPFLVWKGRDRTQASSNGGWSRVRDIRPGTTVIVRADEDAVGRLAHYFQRPTESSLDIADAAYRSGRNQHVIRILPIVLERWVKDPAVSRLLEWARQETPDIDDLRDILAGVASAEGLPVWLTTAARAFAEDRNVRKWIQRTYPDPGTGGRILLGPIGRAAPEDDRYDDEDDMHSESPVAVSLSDHSKAVAALASRFAAVCLGDRHSAAFEEAGLHHDLGKADERFQALLRGSELAAAAQTDPIAKGPNIARQGRHRARLRAAVGLPDRFRHEAASLRLLEQAGGQHSDDDLLVHLISSHHGYGRPFFPVCDDGEPPPIQVSIGPGTELRMDTDTRKALVPLHRLDSGVPERFWRLVRNFGWWGLAYLEALLRLADWEASSRSAVDLEEGRAT